MWNSQRTLSDRFEEGIRHVIGGRYDDALIEFTACVASDPAQFDYVDAFLATLDARDRPKRLTASNSLPTNFQAFVDQQNWETIVKMVPGLVAADSHNAALFWALGIACDALGADEVAILWTTRARKLAPISEPALRASARQWQRLGMWKESFEAWSALAIQVPDDEEAADAMAHLVVTMSRCQNGLDNAAPTPVQELLRKPRRQYGVPLDGDDVDEDDPDLDNNGLLTPIQRLEKAIRDQPTLPEAYLKLAPLYVERGREYDAEKLLAKARESTSKDPRIVEMWEELAMARFERRVAVARQVAREQPGDGTKAEYEVAVRERDHFDTDIFIARCKRYPDRADLRIELGKRLHRSGDTAEACDHFSAALRDPQFLADAAFELGECRRELGDFAKALSHYRQASEAAVSPDKWTLKRKALLAAGRLAIDGGLSKLARRYLNQILKNDPYDQSAQGLMREVATG
jgi:tetratricopeptide (TPR) repeat protein